MIDEQGSMKMPFFEIVENIALGQFGQVNYFGTGSLFWSLSRLFGYYSRIMESYISYKTSGNREQIGIMAADIESFIIRDRIILNDIAFIIRKMYPDQIRYFKNPPHVPVHPLNREMSIIDLYSSFDKNPGVHFEMKKVLDKNRDWIMSIKDSREKIIHYKHKIVLFYPENNEISFALMGAALDEPTELFPDGSRRLILTPVYNFINNEMVSLLRFLNFNLVEVYRNYIRAGKVKSVQVGIEGSTKIVGPTIGMFTRLNPNFEAHTKAI